MTHSDKGFFDTFGGKYVAEVLRRPLDELEVAFHAAMKDSSFIQELKTIQRDYIGRETPLLYAETATRVRKKSRWLLLRSTLLMLAGIFLVMVLGNWYIGNRYSSKTQAKRVVRSNWRDDEWMREVYHLDEVCSFSKLDLHFTGQITTPDHKNREVFVTADIPGSDQIGFWSSVMSRENSLTLGMW